MFSRILVPLDGSERAERALPIAARMARAAGGSLLLLQVLTTPPEYGPTLAPASAGVAAPVPTDADRSEASQYLEQVAARRELSGLPIETQVREGSAAVAILTDAQARGAEAIVLCSHGRTGLTRWVLGSVAEKVARHARIPVLVLRSEGPLPVGPYPGTERPLRALVTLDGSALAEEALVPAGRCIAALAAPGAGALHLLQVVRVGEHGPYLTREGSPTTRDAVVGEAKAYLRAVAERLRAATGGPDSGPEPGPGLEPLAGLALTITYSVALGSDVTDAIVRMAEGGGEDVEGAGLSGGCDVIAMATHGRGGIQRWEVGSVTERVLHATALPLLIVRPGPSGSGEAEPIEGRTITGEAPAWPGVL